MKKQILAVAGTMLTLISANSHAAGCSARARDTSYEIDNKGNVFIEFVVKPRNCADSCSGHVDFRFHYTNRNGSDHFYSRSVKWDSEGNLETEATFKGYESHCRDSNLGPCDTKTVEVTKVSCYD